jgi:hypothetical protein
MTSVVWWGNPEAGKVLSSIGVCADDGGLNSFIHNKRRGCSAARRDSGDSGHVLRHLDFDCYVRSS